MPATAMVKAPRDMRAKGGLGSPDCPQLPWVAAAGRDAFIPLSDRHVAEWPEIELRRPSDAPRMRFRPGRYTTWRFVT